MKVEKRRKQMREAKADMTPMIDMTFQLIAFFMVIVNFSEAESNQLIKLPTSELAKPFEDVAGPMVVLQLTDKEPATVFLGGRELQMGQLLAQLWQQHRGIKAGGADPAAATVVIRADRYAKTSIVQDVIKMCQTAKFQKFALRAKQGQRKPKRKES